MMGRKDLFGKKDEPEQPQEASIEPEQPQKKERPVLTAEDVEALAPLYSDVVLAIKQVYDPEIPVNIYDLGLIYELIISKEHEVFIEIDEPCFLCDQKDEPPEDRYREHRFSYWFYCLSEGHRDKYHSCNVAKLYYRVP